MSSGLFFPLDPNFLRKPMKIKPDQLSKHLSNGLESLYFVFGPEILLVEQSLALIKEAAKANSFLTNRKGKRKNHHGRRHLPQAELGRIFFRIDG